VGSVSGVGLLRCHFPVGEGAVGLSWG